MQCTYIHCWLRWHAAAVWLKLIYPASTCGECSSSFHICLQVKWKTSSVYLKTHVRVCQNEGRERAAQMKKGEGRSEYWMDTLLFPQSLTLCRFSLCSFHPFPIPSLLSLILLLLWDMPLISQAPTPHTIVVC